ncbi:MAG: hypothetical protein F4125_02745 [Acidimicrobiaceae bacterium]|nr:hypothetical protein [Acidimicrobiaceae bacterium]
MDVVIALHVSAALLLVLAGVAKMFRPVPTTDLLASFGLPKVTALVVAIGAAESSVCIAALVVGGPILAAVTGALYLGFLAVVWRALAVGATTCGCFGRVDSPPSWLHVVGNAGFAVVSFVAVAGDTPMQVMGDQPASGIGFVLGAGVIAGLALVAFTAVPEALAARAAPPSSASFRVDSRPPNR